MDARTPPTRPIAVTQPAAPARRVRRPPTLLLTLLVAVLAVTTAIGFLRPVGSGDAALVARLERQVAALDGRLDAAQRCIDGYEAQRREQAGAVREAQSAIEDVRKALGRLVGFDLGAATDLATRAGGRIADAARRLATADRTAPQACDRFR